MKYILIIFLLIIIYFQYTTLVKVSSELKDTQSKLIHSQQVYQEVQRENLELRK